MKAASGVPQQKQKQEGNCCASHRRRRRSRARRLRSPTPHGTRSSTSPGPDPLGRAGDHSLELAGGTSAADLDSRGRVGVEQRQRVGPQAAQARGKRHRGLAQVIAGMDDSVDREEGLVATATERELGQDQRGLPQRRPGRGAAPSGSKAKPPTQTPPAPAGRPGARRPPPHRSDTRWRRRGSAAVRARWP